ncbi:MAG: hypothetical protein Q9213_005644 [Squamulea squamosa]
MAVLITRFSGIMQESSDHKQHPNLPSDWDEYRDIIQRLYVAEDKSLPEVVAEMEEKYQFVATERQYKRRISEWHLDKNVKDEEMRAIIAVEAIRLRQGKKSTFYVRGRLVDPKKIDRFSQRKRIDRGALDSLPGMQQFTTTSYHPSSDYFSMLPANVRCSTPSNNGSNLLEIITLQAGRETTDCRMTHGSTSRTKGSKRIRNMEEEVDAVHTTAKHNRGCGGDSSTLSSQSHKRARNSKSTPIIPQSKKSPKETRRSELQERILDSSTAQLLSTDTVSTDTSAPTQRFLARPEDTSTVSNSTVTTSTEPGWDSTLVFQQWGEAFGRPSTMRSTRQGPSVRTATSNTIPLRLSPSQPSSQDTIDMSSDVVEIRESDWQYSHTKRRGLRPQQSQGSPNGQQQNTRPFQQKGRPVSCVLSSTEHTSTNVAADNSSPCRYDEHRLVDQGSSDDGLPSGMRSLKASAVDPPASLLTLPQHHEEQHNEPPKQGQNFDVNNDSTLSTFADSTVMTTGSRSSFRQVRSGSDSDAPKDDSHFTGHRASSQSRRSKTSNLSEEFDGWERQQRILDVFEAQPPVPSKLTIDDLLQAAQHEQPSIQCGAPEDNRTMSDVYQDQLFQSSTTAFTPPSQQYRQDRHYFPRKDSLSPQKNSVFTDLFQAAQTGHVTARSACAFTSKAQERSPFTLGSPYATGRLSHSRANSPTRLISPAEFREQQKAAADAQVLLQHQPRPTDFQPPRTISPKSVVLENGGEDAGFDRLRLHNEAWYQFQKRCEVRPSSHEQ